MAEENKSSAGELAGSSAKAAGKTNPATSGLSTAADLVTDPKKRKWTLWGILACCGCCAAPFIIGLIIGIATVSSLCPKYFEIKSRIPGAAYVINIAKSDTVQNIYNSLPQAVRGGTSLGLFMQFVNYSDFFDSICGSSLNTIGGNGLPCGEIVEIGDQYVGKWVNEMRTIMTAANFQFDQRAWCAEFVAFVVEQAGYNVRDFHYPHTMNWMIKFRDGVEGWRLLGPGEIPQPGDIAMQHTAGASLTNPSPGQWPHTCIVHEVISDTQFTCLGGNQGGIGPGQRMVTNDSVRSISSFVFGRLPSN